MKLTEGYMRGQKKGVISAPSSSGKPVGPPPSPQPKRRIRDALQLCRKKKENKGMDRKTEKQAETGATIIAGAIHNLADAIREHARAMRGEENEVDDGQFDLSGEKV